MPHGRADGQDRVRDACGENLGRIATNPHRNDLPVLRRGLRANRALPEWTDRESQFAACSLRNAREPLHQGTLRVAIYTTEDLTGVRPGSQLPPNRASAQTAPGVRGQRMLCQFAG